MRHMRLFFKKVSFRDEQKISVDVVECWEVRWYSRHGGYSGDVRQEVRVFPNEDDANTFAEALRDAYALLKHLHGNWVHVEKQGLE